MELNAYLLKYNQHLPALDTDIRQLAAFARNFNQASPDLVQALDDFTVTSETIVQERDSISALYSTLTTASGDLQSFLDANSANIIQLNADSVGTLQILARYSPEFPCALKDLVNFEPAVNKLLGKGTNQPGLHVSGGRRAAARAAQHRPVRVPARTPRSTATTWARTATRSRSRGSPSTTAPPRPTPRPRRSRAARPGAPRPGVPGTRGRRTRPRPSWPAPPRRASWSVS